MRNIKVTKENLDTYFEKLDVNHDSEVSMQEFKDFVDKVNDSETIALLK